MNLTLFSFWYWNRSDEGRPVGDWNFDCKKSS